MKTCPGCNRDLPLDQYAIDRSRKDGHMGRCKNCDNARSRRYYQANRNRKLAAAAARNAAKAQASPPRQCLRCQQPATSSRHWFCDNCRANGARRFRTQRNTPAPPELRCSRSILGCGMDHIADPTSRCRLPLTIEQINALNEEDERHWLQLLAPLHG